MVDTKNSIDISKYSETGFSIIKSIEDTEGVADEYHTPTSASLGDTLFISYGKIKKATSGYRSLMITINAAGDISAPITLSNISSVATVALVAHGDKLYAFYKTGQIENDEAQKIHFGTWDPASNEFTDQDWNKVDSLLAGNNHQVLSGISFKGNLYIFGSYSDHSSHYIQVYKDLQKPDVSHRVKTGTTIKGATAPPDAPMAVSVFGDELALAYRGSDQILYLTKSSNGTDWSTPKALDIMAGSEGAYVSASGPALTVHNGALKLVYTLTPGKPGTVQDGSNMSAWTPRHERIIGHGQKGPTPALVSHPRSGALYLISRVNS
ncbi:hypothetical protein [Mycobacteroides abscessus]|uniref:hypothetical protein n=1 Tax=Mycobacteroides abscessus TaxID=36809 RepID=UPI000D3EA8A1|nr:hypothetical protein [Mycobacteroides abscessus]PVB33016.1 hypothetical protein DDJ45_10295 [Mycobacteroides abscessus]